MARLTLHFCSSNEAAALERSEFVGFSLSEVLVSTRGGVSLEASQGTFPWTQAVRALCILLVTYKWSESCLSPKEQEASAELSGERGSLAASLDSAISKSTQWLVDMFGLDSSGISNIRRLVRRANPERKRPGPVVVRISPAALKRGDIRIFLDSNELFTEEEFRALRNRLSWHPVNQPRAAARNDDHADGQVSKGSKGNGGTLSFSAPVRVGVCSFIPFYHGKQSSSQALKEENALQDGRRLRMFLFNDGYGVGVVRGQYCCLSVADFLMQRRTSHLAFLQLDSLSPAGSNFNIRDIPVVAPSSVPYVMSVHYFCDPCGSVSELQRICMAEPSILGITDDPDTGPPQHRTIDAFESIDRQIDYKDAVDKLVFGRVTYYASWANVLAVITKPQIEQVLILEKLEIELQHLWYKIHHFLESLGGAHCTITRLGSRNMEKYQRYFDEIRTHYHAFRMIRPTAATDVVALRTCLAKTSKIDALFGELARFFENGWSAEKQRVRASQKASGA